MKKFIKSNLKVFIAIIVTAVICIGGTVLASVQFQATEVGYKNTTVDRALDDLYNRASGSGTGSEEFYCFLAKGTGKTVGAKYYCNPGDGLYKGFYVLKVNENDVELIMEKNLSDEIGSSLMDYDSAIAFINTYEIDSSWKNALSVDLPSIQDIVDAGGITNWDATTATSSNWSYFGVNSNSETSHRSEYAFLYSYTRNCLKDGCDFEYPNSNPYPNGYWTKSIVSNDNNSAWVVYGGGHIYARPKTYTDTGVRPVITISKSKLSS